MVVIGKGSILSHFFTHCSSHISLPGLFTLRWLVHFSLSGLNGLDKRGCPFARKEPREGEKDEDKEEEKGGSRKERN